jgi:uncharacterized membrane protein YphA (DoxX/SURF4 family)
MTMKLTTKIPTAARILLGAVFVVFGLNGFLQFLPAPPMPAGAAAFGGALMATGYMFPLLKSLEVVAGLLLLTNFYVPLALAVLAPIIVNITAFHLFLAPEGLAVPIVLVALEIYLAWSKREAFAPMLRAKDISDHRTAEVSTGHLAHS